MRTFSVVYWYTDPYCSDFDGMNEVEVLADSEEQAVTKFREDHHEETANIQSVVIME